MSGCRIRGVDSPDRYTADPLLDDLIDLDVLGAHDTWSLQDRNCITAFTTACVTVLYTVCTYIIKLDHDLSSVAFSLLSFSGRKDFFQSICSQSAPTADAVRMLFRLVLFAA